MHAAILAEGSGAAAMMGRDSGMAAMMERVSGSEISHTLGSSLAGSIVTIGIGNAVLLGVGVSLTALMVKLQPLSIRIFMRYSVKLWPAKSIFTAAIIGSGITVTTEVGSDVRSIFRCDFLGHVGPLVAILEELDELMSARVTRAQGGVDGIHKGVSEGI
ncbi:hypothetical protein DPX16_19520 [Anabarilius grahami]|uniref:Uncharacterized protein n=1 Tax=Anabarilius grahami TaxID=495550 RepID=A0A3N0Y791_ANAGA|nr:hypothetical protein DPX16_19520 [Anabarilius grahami]